MRPCGILAADRRGRGDHLGSLGLVDDDAVSHAAADSAPDTVTEAMVLLAAEGYTADVVLGASTFTCAGCSHALPVVDASVDRVFRFEGESDPGDEMIVIGLSCPSCGQRGILVSAFGPDADQEHAEALRTLAGRRTD